MVLGVTPEDLVVLIGHDGQEVVFPDQHGYKARKGYHIQEIINCVISMGHGLMPIEKYPCSIPVTDCKHIHDVFDNIIARHRFKSLIKDKIAILEGQGHACAWDGEKIYDPMDTIYDLDNPKFRPMTAWILI